MKYGNWTYQPKTRTKPQLRCDDIEEQLLKHNIQAEVCRHHINNWLFYDLKIPTQQKEYVGEKEIATALNIDKKYVHFIHIDCENKYKIIWVEEEKLHEHHLTSNGLLCFNNRDLMKDYAINYIDNENYIVTEIKEDFEEVTIELHRCKI